jgi:diguanylate cyclase (GGDEF)-like protein
VTRALRDPHHKSERGVRARTPRGEIEEGRTRVTTLRLRANDGVHHWVEIHAGPFTTALGVQDGSVASYRVVDAEVDAQEVFARRATYDDLTGVLKRDPALEPLKKIGHQPRRPGTETGVLFIDIDDFKAVNDTWGHVAGDTVLKAMADRLRASIRSADSVSRMGGDEFLVTLEAINDLPAAVTVAEKLRVACSEPITTLDGDITATVSIGVTLVDPIETGDELVARADRAMYRAKDVG